MHYQFRNRYCTRMKLLEIIILLLHCPGDARNSMWSPFLLDHHFFDPTKEVTRSLNIAVVFHTEISRIFLNIGTSPLQIAQVTSYLHLCLRQQLSLSDSELISATHYSDDPAWCNNSLVTESISSLISSLHIIPSRSSSLKQCRVSGARARSCPHLSVTRYDTREKRDKKTRNNRSDKVGR